MALPLLTYVRKGMALVPIGRHQKRFGDAFAEGEYYDMEVREERSRASHNQFFALVTEYFRTMPESAAMEPWAQSAEHLRRYALIKTGWSDTQTFACGSQAEAQRWAANLRPLDEYSIIVAKGSIVMRFTAKSQSMRAMGKKDFQQSKDDVLGFLAQLVGGEGTGTAA